MRSFQGVFFPLSEDKLLWLKHRIFRKSQTHVTEMNLYSNHERNEIAICISFTEAGIISSFLTLYRMICGDPVTFCFYCFFVAVFIHLTNLTRNTIMNQTSKKRAVHCSFVKVLCGVHRPDQVPLVIVKQM